MIDALLLTVLATRWALLAYIHSSSFGALNEVYLSPLSAILILLILLNIIYFIENGMKVTQEQGETKL